MNLLLEILTKTGYIVDQEKKQIIDKSNQEAGSISLDGELVTYSFSSGRKIIFNSVENKATVQIAGDLDIGINYEPNDNNICIFLNMKLSNGTSCRLEHKFHQGTFIDYKVVFNHLIFKEDMIISFTKMPMDLEAIYYEYYKSANTTISYSGILKSDYYNTDGISKAVSDCYLNHLIADSGLFSDNDIQEINSIMKKGMNIIGISINKLIKFFLSYDFNEHKKMPSRVMALFQPQTSEQSQKIKKDF